MGQRHSVLFVAVHMGAYAALESLEAAFGPGRACFLVDGPARQARQRSGLGYWDLERVRGSGRALDQFLRQRGVRAMICGTSDGLPSGNLEDLAREESNRVRLPIFVVEDFPGNYQHRPSTSIQGLFIEHGSTKESHVNSGVKADHIHCFGNPRYDTLLQLDREAIRGCARQRFRLGNGPVVLWAGQPEEAQSFEAFARITPCLAELKATLLFKAHPRDRLYESGAYLPLLERFSQALDVSRDTDTRALCCAADLVLTQFSSLAVEASYLGTPSLFLLLEDLGKTYLRNRKGYSVLPWVEEESAFLIDSMSKAQARLEEALFDGERRGIILRNFDRVFKGVHPSAEKVRNTILTALDGNVHAQPGEC